MVEVKACTLNANVGKAVLPPADLIQNSGWRLLNTLTTLFNYILHKEYSVINKITQIILFTIRYPQILMD